ncbi:MAG: hypothetical protein EXX96DRAFT_547503 [Benjaminiella poitrasii]|nr:MAG: hypothetical protein EXX96DRAFT_547503 [Benjaminiella poitrasii]
MPTATRQQHIMLKPSYSSNTATIRSSIKLAPSIKSASIISFKKCIMDQKIWYLIKVEPLQQYKHSLTTDNVYYVKRRYEDFCQLSQSMHERFGTNKQRTGSRPLPKIKTKLSILPTGKHIHAQRVEELNQFLSILFQKQSLLTESYLVHEFFGIQKSDLVSVSDHPQASIASPSEKENKHSKLAPPSPPDMVQPNYNQHQEANHTTSRWKRLRCTSFLARSPPSGTGLSSFCSQAANKIMPSWHRNNNSSVTSTTIPSPPLPPCSPKPSNSTPASNFMTAPRSLRQRNTSGKGEGNLKKCKSSLCIVSDRSEFTQANQLWDSSKSINSNSHFSTASLRASSLQSSQQRSTIKIKVIYDAHNIIVIQVPRTISLQDLRSRIAQKFSDPSIGSPIQVHHKELVLLFNDNGSSYCSTVTCSSSSSSSTEIALPAILIHKEQDLAHIMQTKWVRMNKVTLRCIM